MIYSIPHRVTEFPPSWRGEINCDDDAPESARLGAAVVAAVRQGASLSGADLGGADLRGVDFRGARLHNVWFGDADLRGAVLTGAALNGASFYRADLRGAVLTGVLFTGVSFARADIADTCLIDGGQRSDGRRCVGWFNTWLWVNIGSEDIRLGWARARVLREERETALGRETLAILDRIERTASIRGIL